MSACRFCGGPLETSLIDLGAQPFANSYLEPTPEAVAAERRHPLHVKVCGDCLLAQVEETAPPDDIFHGGYAYFSSMSAGWVAHAERFVSAAVDRCALGASSFVVEVASNDGYLLQHLAKRGVPHLGVEPAAACAEAAAEKGVETDVAFFDVARAEKIRSERGPADLTIANNVLAHVPDIGGFARAFATLLAEDGVACFEFPHLLELVRGAQFDTIYHEHYAYLSLAALDRVFAAADLRVFDVEQLRTHGGSLRLFVCKRRARWCESAAVGAIRADERAAGLDRIDGYAALDLAERAAAQRAGLLARLDAAAEAGRTVAAYGAAAKGNTFLNYCGVGPDQIAFAVDRSPLKQGRLLPGSHIPVRAPDALRAVRPDEIVVLPWNLADEIAREHAYAAEWGARFFVAAPEIRELAIAEPTPA